MDTGILLHSKKESKIKTKIFHSKKKEKKERKKKSQGKWKLAEISMSQATWCPLWRYWSARIICSRNQLSRLWQAHWRRLRPRPRPLRSRPRTRAEPHTAPLPSLRPGTGSWPLLTQEPATCPQ